MGRRDGNEAGLEDETATDRSAGSSPTGGALGAAFPPATTRRPSRRRLPLQRSYRRYVVYGWRGSREFLALHSLARCLQTRGTRSVFAGRLATAPFRVVRRDPLRVMSLPKQEKTPCY